MCPEEYTSVNDKNYHKNRLSSINNSYNENKQQRHMHGFLGSTRVTLSTVDNHNHRFAGITGEAIPSNDSEQTFCEGISPFVYESHIHNICINTDYSDHFHKINIKTGTAIQIGHGKHVHLVTGTTDFEKNHYHDFIFDTLAESQVKT